MAVITISRQYGSEGNEIANRVCELLGYRYFDKNLMLGVADEMSLSADTIVDLTEDDFKMRGFLDRLLGHRSLPIVTPANAPVDSEDETVQENARNLPFPYDPILFQDQHALLSNTLTIEQLNEEWCVGTIEKLIQGACEQGNVVIVGRGGQAVLKNATGVLHVRIFAPLDVRVKRVQYREMTWMTHKLQLAEAKKAVAEHDKAAAAYVRRFYHIDWDDLDHYHLAINSARWGIEGAAYLIARSISYLPGIHQGRS
ncbi:MAG: cytidylate kinase-like family protein [Anaerolineae bacterium]|nr:cytidylate kinase-like family protein [Anaerolineae bacterium]